MAEKKKKVIVVGGGITGLTAAYRLITDSAKSGTAIEVKILDAAERMGGVIGTQHQDGLVMEEGPDCFISTKPQALDLFRQLGIEKEVISTSNEHRQSYILRGNRLLPVPKGFYLLAPDSFVSLARTPIFSPQGKARMACDLIVPRRQSDEDESLESFVIRRLGREALDRMAQPMVAGIYSADPSKLSLKATFPQFLEWEKEYGSVIRALWERKRKQTNFAQASGPRYSLFLSFKNGIQTLTNRLQENLPQDCAHTGVRVEQIRRVISSDDACEWQLETDQGLFEADALCLALPANLSGRFLSGVLPAVSKELSGIDYHGAITANMIYRRCDVAHPLDGFGFVVPAVEGKTLIACSFSSVKFAGRAPDDLALLRAFIGGPGQQALVGADDDLIVDLIHKDLDDILGLDARPLQTLVSHWKNVMPQYHVGHLERIKRIEDGLCNTPSLALAGNAYGGVGIPDCIGSANRSASQILNSLQAGLPVLNEQATRTPPSGRSTNSIDA